MTGSGSRGEILAALRAAARSPLERPEPAVRPGPPADPVAALRAGVLAAGGRLLELSQLGSDAIELALPTLRDAADVWSGVAETPSRGVALHAAHARELDCLDYAILRGELAVAECGAVWNVPAGPLERAAALLAEHLVLVVARESIVAHLHAAYQRIDPARAAFGWLISGPSKTADIEQALVHGAHGPRAMTLLLHG